MIWSLGLALLAMAACVGGNGGGRENAAVGQLAQYKRTLQFLTDMGISPDTLLMSECINFPIFRDTVSHSHWLTAEEAETLGMKRLCGVDADGTPAILLGVDTISDQVTLLLYQVYYGDKSPVVLITYDTDGIVMDMLDAGTWAGVNTLYANEHDNAMDLGVDSAEMWLEDNGKFTVEHFLTMVQRPTHGGETKQLWRHYTKYFYQVDPVTGIIKEYDMEYALPNVNNDDIVRRHLEMLSWKPVSDENAMSGYEYFAEYNEAALSQQSLLSTLYAFSLFERLDLAPWPMLEWLYEHQDSRVYRLFIDAVKEHEVDRERLEVAVNLMQNDTVKQYWRKQFNLE